MNNTEALTEIYRVINCLDRVEYREQVIRNDSSFKLPELDSAIRAKDYILSMANKSRG